MTHPASADALLAWGVPRLRDLPWRATRDPWLITTSEFMLQQTQVARVLDRWPRFVEQYPTAAACADAPLADVLRAWQGLGYPRRARNLHELAGRVRHEFPSELAELLALPGVGPYTARAILTFAFEADAAVVDTNIARVYARLVGRRLTAREVQALADAAVPPGASWLWNQCLMDLGALVCRPAPMCGECPWRAECAWRGEGPDPAVGSAGVSTRQARFAGSDREARGRLMRALGDGPIAVESAASVMGRDVDTAQRLVAALVAEGLADRRGALLALPGDPPV